MGRKKYTDAQISLVVNEVEGGTRVSDLFRKLGVSEQSIYQWKKRFSGMQTLEIRRLRQLEDENAKLKKVAANLTLDRVMLQEV